MSLYEIAILGSASHDNRVRLTETIRSMIEDFDLTLGQDVLIHNSATVGHRDKGAAFAAVYFGGVPHVDADVAQELVRSSAPIIPTIAAGGNFGTEVPDILQGANGLARRNDDPEMTELAAAILEVVGLLRRQRRVFVSYRRVKSTSAALQLHDLLISRGFDVFLDTHDIRPGDPFQDVLWHRLVDCDVMVMLDTPAYFESRWTRQEIGRARAKEIQVLRVIWPEHKPTKLTDLAETVYLNAAELEGPTGPIIAPTAEAIALRVERLRSRSIAARYMSITGKLRADVEKVGGKVEGIGRHRAIAVRLFDDRTFWAYPVVGIPSAEALNDVAGKAKRADHGEAPILVYDHIGIRDAWSAHLRWLDEEIKSVRAIKVSEAGWELVGLAG